MNGFDERSCLICRKQKGVCLRPGFKGHLPFECARERPKRGRKEISVSTTAKEAPLDREQPACIIVEQTERNLKKRKTLLTSKTKTNGKRTPRRLVSCSVIAKDQYIWSDGKDHNPVSFLKSHGYVHLKRGIPEKLCLLLKQLIEKDMSEKRDMAKEKPNLVYHQEEPLERMSQRTSKYMKIMRKYVVTRVLREIFDKRARVPKGWDETAYGRVKMKHDYTSPHRDYVNTIIERNLLAKVEDLQFPSSCINWKGKGKTIVNDMSSSTRKARKTADRVKLTDELILSSILMNELSRPIDEYVPIYTVWVSLHSLETFGTSHLRIHPNSHAIHDLEIIRHKTSKKVIGVDSKFYRNDANSNKKAFLYPNAPYEMGDVVIFHCLTRHDANRHESKSNCGSSRVSFDMRVLMDGMSSNDHGLMFCV